MEEVPASVKGPGGRGACEARGMKLTQAMIAALLALAACGHGAAKSTGPAPAAPTAMIDFTSIDSTSTKVAGYPIDFAGDWRDLHARLKLEAKQLVQPTTNNPKPTGKLTLYVYEAHDQVPDLATTADGDLPMEHLLALYDNTLTGAWRFCFGGTKGAADMTKCVFDADPVTATTYDPAASE